MTLMIGRLGDGPRLGRREVLVDDDEVGLQIAEAWMIRSCSLPEPISVRGSND